MWPFLFNDESLNVNKLNAQNLESYLDNLGDLAEFKVLDTSLKFWIPETLKAALEQLCDHNDESLSNLLRKALFVHCYGLYAYLLAVKSQERIFRHSTNDVLFSRSSKAQAGEPTYWVAKLGKNIAPTKVFLPSRLKADLQKLADYSQKTLSEYIREIVISRIFGHGFLPISTTTISQSDSQIIEKWINDEDIPMDQVTEDEFYNHKIRMVIDS